MFIKKVKTSKKIQEFSRVGPQERAEASKVNLANEKESNKGTENK